ncbi:hypothetical protein UF75_2939 [Desulfosporosinus sp. I2]|nr:hypothetical protein UF75_2939 [Desulfosporosinus sp. I2]
MVLEMVIKMILEMVVMVIIMAGGRGIALNIKDFSWAVVY